MSHSTVRFLCDATSRLVALEGNDGLLDIKTIFRYVDQQKEVRNVPFLLTFVICGRALQILVWMLSIRVEDAH